MAVRIYEVIIFVHYIILCLMNELRGSRWIAYMELPVKLAPPLPSNSIITFQINHPLSITTRRIEKAKWTEYSGQIKCKYSHTCNPLDLTKKPYPFRRTWTYSLKWMENLEWRNKKKTNSIKINAKISLSNWSLTIFSRLHVKLVYIGMEPYVSWNVNELIVKLGIMAMASEQ